MNRNPAPQPTRIPSASLLGALLLLLAETEERYAAAPVEDHTQDPSATGPYSQRAAGPSAASFGDLLVRYAAPLRTYLRLHFDPLLRARESCSDMVQSVFRECLGEASQFEFRHEAALRKWLFQKALSKVLDRRRYWLADKRDPQQVTDVPVDALPAASGSASTAAIHSEELAALEQCFEELSPDHRRVIVAARLLEQPHAEIATEMGCSTDAVGMLLHRALARLAMRMRARSALP